MNSEYQNPPPIQTLNYYIMSGPHFSKAIHKLQHYGVTGRINECIKSWLCHRQQRVVLDGSTSPTRMSFLGIQETVIGPLMFLLYVNDIGNNFSPQTSLSSLRMTAFFTRPSIVSQMRSSSNRIYMPWLSGPIPG